jgi:hypothetical protein
MCDMYGEGEDRGVLYVLCYSIVLTIPSTTSRSRLRFSCAVADASVLSFADLGSCEPVKGRVETWRRRSGDLDSHQVSSMA